MVDQDTLKNAPLVNAFISAKSGNYDDLWDYLNGDNNVNSTLNPKYFDVDEDLLGGRTLLMIIAKFIPSDVPVDEYEELLRTMKAKGANPNITSHSRATAPMFATHNGNTVAANFFAAWEEVDWQLRTSSGMSAYDFATDSFQFEILGMLKKYTPHAVTLSTAQTVAEKNLCNASMEDAQEYQDSIEKTFQILGMPKPEIFSITS